MTKNLLKIEGKIHVAVDAKCRCKVQKHVVGRGERSVSNKCNGFGN